MNRNERLMLMALVGSGLAAGTVYAVYRAKRKPPQSLPPPSPVLVLPPPAASSAQAPAASSAQPPAPIVPVSAPSMPRSPQPITYEVIPYEAPHRRAWLPWTFAALAGVALLFVGLGVLRPRITALAAPPSVLAGTVVSVSYAAEGSGTLQYTIESAGLKRSALLAPGEGTLFVPVARQLANHDVFVTMRMRGALGSDARLVRISILASPKPSRALKSDGPRIEALTLSQMSVTGGGTVGVSYRSNAAAGNLRLTDGAGAVWQTVPLRGSGSVRFAVPVMERDTPFVVVAHAERNGQHTDASAAFIVRGRAVASPNAAPAPTLGTKGAPPFWVPATARSGATLSLTVPRGLTNVEISLATADGTEVQRATPSEGDAAVALQLPVVHQAALYIITLSYQAGAEKETLIRRLTVTPASSLLP